MPCISIVNYALPKGGAEKVSLILADYFIEHGWNVHLVVFGDSIEWRINSSIQILNLGIPNSPFGYISRLFRYLKLHKPTCVIANCWPIHTYTVISAKLALNMTPVIVVEHFSISGSFNSMHGYKRYLFIFSLFATYLFSSKGVAISKAIYRSFILMGIPSRKLIPIYNPMYFPDQRRTRGTISRTLSNSTVQTSQTITILMAGTLCPRKDYRLAINSFHVLTRNYSSNYEMIIAGQGPDLDKLIELRNLLGLDDKIHFKGRVDNMGHLYSHANIFFLTSLFEGLPSVLIEALAHGLTVVSVDCKDGPLEILGSNYPYLVASRDPCVLAAALFNASIRPVSAEECFKLVDPFSAPARCSDYFNLALSFN